MQSGEGQTGEGAWINGSSSVFKCLMFRRGRGRRAVGKLGGVACSMILEGMREASRRKYKGGILQTGHFR